MYLFFITIQEEKTNLLILYNKQPKHPDETNYETSLIFITVVN